VATNAVADYTIQASEIGVLNHVDHFSTPVAAATTVDAGNLTTCTAACVARNLTVMADVRAVGYASVVLLITNLALVLWVLALRGGRLWGSPVVADVSTPAEDGEQQSGMSRTDYSAAEVSLVASAQPNWSTPGCSPAATANEVRPLMVRSRSSGLMDDAIMARSRRR
jgi:hypothetical protein